MPKGMHPHKISQKKDRPSAGPYVQSFYLSSSSLIARIKSLLFSTVGLGIEVISARSFVIFPLSIVPSVALSRRSAKSHSSEIPSSSPLLRSAPVQAKIVATELVEVSSPFRCL